MSDWHVNEGLAPLITEVKDAHPGMVVGTIGDAAHQNEVSDHNPNQYGRVNAADFMLGTRFTEKNATDLLPYLIVDKRTHYVIHDRKIWTSETKAWKTYTGSDPHTNHIHISVLDSAYTNTKPWNIGADMAFTDDDAATLFAHKLADGETAGGHLVDIERRLPTNIDARLSTIMSSLAALENQVDSLVTTTGGVIGDDELTKIATKVVDMIETRLQS